MRIQQTSSIPHSTLIVCFCVLSLSVLAGGGAAAVHAQEETTQSDTTAEPQRGFRPGGSYALSNIESINTVNGNLMMNLPLGALPAGRGGLSAGINLLYNSKLYDLRTRIVSSVGEQREIFNVQESVEGGWRYALRYELQVLTSGYQPPTGNQGSTITCQDYHRVYYYKVKLALPDGSLHELRLHGYGEENGFYAYKPDGTTTGYCASPPPLNGDLTYYTTDGTFLKLIVRHDADQDWENNPWTLYLPDGSRVTGGNAPQRIYDRNNNYIEIQDITYNNHPATRLVDQFNRCVLIEYGSDTDEDSIHVQGFGGELVTRVKWKEIHVNKTYLGANSFGEAVGQSYTGHLPVWSIFRVVDRITLPAQAGNLSYTFEYNAPDIEDWNRNIPSQGWGEISSIILPTGARANYQYQLDGSNSSSYPIADTVIKNAPTRKDLVYRQEYDNSSTPVTESWLYSINQNTGVSEITAPDGGVTRESYNLASPGWQAGLSYRTEKPDGTVIEREWQPNIPYGLTGYPSIGNAYVKKEFISIRNAAGNPVKTAIKDFNYDKNGNVTRVAEYDWVDYSSVHDGGGNPAWNVSGLMPKRVTANVYHCFTPDAADNSQDSPNSYHKAGAPRLLKAIAASEVQTGTGTVVSRSEFFYDDAATTGNLIRQKSWDSVKGAYSNPLTSSNSISVARLYDVYGNLTVSTDARGNQTKLVYGPVGGHTDLYPTQTISAFGTGVQRTASRTYDFNTGLVIGTTDVDNNVTNETVYDVFGRTIETRAAANVPGAKTIKRIEYSDINRRVITRSDLNTAYDGRLVSIEHYDELGRIRLTRKLEDALTQSATDETTGLKVQTRYAYSGSNSYRVSSNPYRAATSGAASAEATMGWTRSKSDNAGRVVEVGTFAGSSLPAPWGTNTASTGFATTAYDGEYTTMTDQAGKVRRSRIDAQGQLVRVDEPEADNNLGSVDAPVQPTIYAYDALANLTQVTQGAQTRSFSYSSLSRLTSATNPENGLVSYQYDDNGNLTQRMDARNIVSIYGYDQLNRLTSKTYQNDNGATPAVYYKYDAQGLPDGAPTFERGWSAGRLVAVLYGGPASTTGSYQGYDALGRVKRSIQVTHTGQSTETYLFPNYDYNLAGDLTSQTFPSGRVVTTAYDNAGRLSQVSGQKTGEAGKTYASSFNYSAHGAVSEMKLGNNLWEHTIFNSRLQPVLIGLGTSQSIPTAQDFNRFRVDYYYGAADNNGNVRQQTISVPDAAGNYVAQMSQTYSYDELNRLKSAVEVSGGSQSWRQTYQYDRYGNRSYDSTQTTMPAPLQKPGINNANNNRINAGQGYGYDPAGNLTSEPNQSFSYDAENRMVSYNGGNPLNGGGVFSYDGEGRRIKKVSATGTTIFVYNALGQISAEYTDNSTGTGNATSYLTTDNLGSPRIITGANGSVKARHDYLPFGEEIMAEVGGRTTSQGYVVDSVRQKFTSKERDAETGLDYFGARYYSSTQGRFTSVDPLMASARTGNPQTWNRYSYTWNNPINLIDPLGLDPQEDGRSFTVTNPCQMDGTSRCGPAFNLNAGDIVAEPDLIPTTDVQMVSELQTLTGVENPIPPRSHTLRFLDWALGGNNGATLGSATITWGARSPQGAGVIGGIVGAGLLGAMLRDALKDDPTDLPIPFAPPLPYKADPLQTVFRVFGGESQQAGFSWTPIDPRTVPNYRDAAGLPPGNSGEFLVAGEVRAPDIIIIRPALPIPPNKGGLTEYVINPASVINQRVTPLVPPF
jgi:RHS repeat-associated protein